MLLTVKEVSAWLNIKPSTLYHWAAQGKIPSRKNHGLIRFEPEVITGWLGSLEVKQVNPAPSRARSPRSDLDQVIEAAKRDAYTSRHGETISPSPTGKENENGAR